MSEDANNVRVCVRMCVVMLYAKPDCILHTYLIVRASFRSGNDDDENAEVDDVDDGDDNDGDDDVANVRNK